MENNKTTWLQCSFALVLLFLFAIGVIGGCGNLIYYGEYVPAIGVAVCGWLAMPKVKEYWNEFFK